MENGMSLSPSLKRFFSPRFATNSCGANRPKEPRDIVLPRDTCIDGLPILMVDGVFDRERCHEKFELRGDNSAAVSSTTPTENGFIESAFLLWSPTVDAPCCSIGTFWIWGDDGSRIAPGTGASGPSPNVRAGAMSSMTRDALMIISVVGRGRWINVHLLLQNMNPFLTSSQL